MDPWPLDPEELFAATERAYAALRADAVAWGAELAERALWDCTLLDGLEGLD